MPIVTVTRRLTFNAAHRVHNPELSDLENARLFGKCNNPNWHGHNYELEVSVRGAVEDRTGYVMDLARLKDVVIRNGNIFEELVRAVRVCSLGQITKTLFDVGGQYRRSM